MNCVQVRLADIACMRTGKLDSNAAVKNGEYPFFTCSQQTFRIDTPAFDTKAVILGGNNAAGVFPLKYYEGQFNAYQRTYVIESLDPNFLDIRFLYYSLRLVLSHFQSISIGVATQYLTKKILDNFKIPLPEISTQTSIAAILSAYDDLIENNRRRIHLLEQAARLLYKEWFIHLRFPGHEHTKIIDGVPEGWLKGTVSDICSRMKVNYTLNDENLPLVDLSRMRRKTLSVVESGSSADLETSRIIFEIDDILFSSIRPYLHKVVLAPFKGITNTSVFVVRAKKIHLRAYLAILLSDNYTVAHANQHTTGTKMPVVKWASIASMPALIPPKSILDNFGKIANPMLKKIKLFYFYNRRLTQARDLLLPRLMSGKLVV